ncbi:hypothetical protein MRX96_001879 [Rhipicephalus microplus]
MDVRIGSSTFKALLDTGSSVSFFGPHATAAAQASGAKPKADVRVLRLASGWSQSTMSLKCQIEWAAGCRRQQFLCVPDLCRDVVLGRDFLTVSGISLHVSLGGWTVGTEPQRIVPFVKVVKEHPEAVDDFGDSLRCIFAESDATVCASVPEATAACNVIISGHSSDLDPRMKNILEEFSEIFTTTPGCTTLAEHRIDTGDNPPVRCKLRPVNSKKQAIMDNCIQDLLAQNLIRPSQSQHASAPVLVEKKSGGYRMAVDYRQLNARTKAIHLCLLDSEDVSGDPHAPNPLIRSLFKSGAPCETSRKRRTLFHEFKGLDSRQLPAIETGVAIRAVSAEINSHRFR